MSVNEVEKFRLDNRIQECLEKFVVAEKKENEAVESGMKLLREVCGKIWEGERFTLAIPLEAQVEYSHPAIPEEIRKILLSRNPDLHSKLKQYTIRIYNPTTTLRLQFKGADGKTFDLQGDHKPSIEVYPHGDSAEGLLVNPNHLLAKIIRALPHIAKLEYRQETT